MKNSLEGLSNKFKQEEEWISDLEVRSFWDYWIWRTENKKNEEKWAELQRSVTHHQVYQDMHKGSPKRRGEKREERIFEE